MRAGGATRSRAALWLALGAILAVVIWVTLPGRGRFVSVIQNAGHGPAFAAISLIAIQLMQAGSVSSARAALALCARILALVLVLGIGVEIAQGFSGGDADPVDVLRDLLGATAALVFWTRRGLRDTPRIAATACGILCIGLWLWPLAVCAAAYWHRAHEFPVVASFTDRRDLYFVETPPPLDERVLVPVDSGHARFPGELALSIKLDRLRWPGVTLDEPAPDWSRFSQLHVEVTNPGTHTLEVGVRINDRAHTYRYEDRFTRKYPCEARTRCRFDISLREVQSAPRGRLMDMRAIAMIIVFHDGPSAGDELLVHRLWLD